MDQIQEKKFLKGSEWRKWDLHVHTPNSILNRNFGSDWDIYIKKLFKTLIEKRIAVVGITDYFTISEYKKIKEEYLSNEGKLSALFSTQEIEEIKKILILPNIEFRSNIFVGSKNSINFHIIFSEEVLVKDIEEKFLHEIDFLYEGDPQSKDKKEKLKESNLQELGAKLKREHKEFHSETDLEVGMKNAVVDHSQITDILNKKIFGGKYLFIVSADEDLSNIHWNSRDHQTRKVIIQKSDFLFSANDKTRSWALGKNPYTQGADSFIKEFASLKPCIHGSDAHEFEFIGHPCSKRGDESHTCLAPRQDCKLKFCWIKANPTFEGLKQLLYEPEDRIYLQKDDPNFSRSIQTMLNFNIKGAELSPELKFKETFIPFNHGLIAVTGGKGSGKTALVDLIANHYEDRVLCKDKNSFVRRITENKKSYNLKSTLKLNNEKEHTKNINESVQIEESSVVYVAQGELEHHIEDPGLLENHINNLIFESFEIKDTELLFDYQNINNELSEIQEKINATNQNIFNLENKSSIKIEENLNKEIKKLETDIKDLEKNIAEVIKNISPDKIKKSEEEQKELTQLRDRKEWLNNLGLSLKEGLKFLNENVLSFNKEISNINDLCLKLTFGKNFKNIDYPDKKNLEDFIEVIRTEFRKTLIDIEKFQKNIQERANETKQHSKFLDDKKILEKSLEDKNSELKNIKNKRESLKEEYQKRLDLFKKIINKKIDQKRKYIEIINIFSKNKNDILNDLDFTVEMVFLKDNFFKKIEDILDHRKIKDDLDPDIASYIHDSFSFAEDPLAENIESISKKATEIVLPKVIEKQRKSESINHLTIYNSIFRDYFTLVPSVKYKNVSLAKLSLGQKASVLLKIYLAQGVNPIIIDSHDDHLDNEFIMEELVKALRQAKQHRQVIVVSNNGNVVVNSDAEQVIMACRNETGEISYVSGAIESPELRSKLLSVLEGGEEAFSKRWKKYSFRK